MIDATGVTARVRLSAETTLATSFGAPGVVGVDGLEIESPEPPRWRRDRDGAAPGQLRSHGVGRIGHRGIQHRVLVRSAQAEHVRHRGDELLGADAGGDGRPIEVREPEATRQPGGRGVAQRRAAGRGGITPLGVRRRQCIDHGERRRVVGGPNGAVHHATLVRLRHLGQDFELEIADSRDGPAYRLGNFKAFLGQREHDRHQRFAASRATVS